MGDPVGLNCPGCGQPPVWLFGGGHQAFCGSDDCPWFTWDPAKTLAELNASANVIDLGGDQGSSDGDQVAGCPDCNGAGCHPDMEACPTCFGTGRAQEDLGHLTDAPDGSDEGSGE